MNCPSRKSIVREEKRADDLRLGDSATGRDSSDAIFISMSAFSEEKIVNLTFTEVKSRGLLAPSKSNCCCNAMRVLHEMRHCTIYLSHIFAFRKEIASA